MTAFVVGVFITFCVATPGGIMSGLMFALMASPFVILSYYFWLVVRSVYLDIKEMRRNPSAPYEAPYEAVTTKAEKNGDYAKF